MSQQEQKSLTLHAQRWFVTRKSSPPSESRCPPPAVSFSSPSLEGCTTVTLHLWRMLEGGAGRVGRSGARSSSTDSNFSLHRTSTPTRWICRGTCRCWRRRGWTLSLRPRQRECTAIRMRFFLRESTLKESSLSEEKETCVLDFSRESAQWWESFLPGSALTSRFLGRRTSSKQLWSNDWRGNFSSTQRLLFTKLCGRKAVSRQHRETRSSPKRRDTKRRVFLRRSLW
mmetsp:Transcript_5430/g.10741  ORF Transcript_5430/g.10741 Transcript_5430/m.10741 type:complete len:228 (+) Transcript_5430:617-1300(+)